MPPLYSRNSPRRPGDRATRRSPSPGARPSRCCRPGGREQRGAVELPPRARQERCLRPPGPSRRERYVRPARPLPGRSGIPSTCPARGRPAGAAPARPGLEDRRRRPTPWPCSRTSRSRRGSSRGPRPGPTPAAAQAAAAWSPPDVALQYLRARPRHRPADHPDGGLRGRDARGASAAHALGRRALRRDPLRGRLPAAFDRLADRLGEGAGAGLPFLLVIWLFGHLRRRSSSSAASRSARSSWP